MTAAETDFGAYLDQYMGQMRTTFETGEKVKGLITAIDRNSVFVDLNAKSEGVLDLNEVRDENGEVTVKVGEEIEAFCISFRDDQVRLTLRMTGDALRSSLQDAYEAGIPVEGRVTEERKGGYSVDVGGHQGFCPYSQINLHRDDTAQYVGEKFLFRITQYDEEGRNLVLSRRPILEEQKTDYLQDLDEAMTEGRAIQGTVKAVKPYGAFVDVGNGVQGLVPIREMSWARVEKSEDIVAVGDEVTVTVKEIDWAEERITLSLRDALGNPWDTVSERYGVGSQITGTVTRIMPFGAFVQLEPGIEGLVHISRLGAGRRVNSPAEVVNEGDQVEVAIESIDLERKRIGLTMDIGPGPMAEESADDRTEVTPNAPLRPGMQFTGTVEEIKDYGVFIRLPNGENGLLHHSQVDLDTTGNRGRALYRRFPPQSHVEVVIQRIDGRKVSLTLPETLEKERAEREVSDYTDRSNGDLGSLGDLLDGLKL